MEQPNNSFRYVVIDGPTTVCTDSTGDIPLFQMTIDPSKCSFQDVAQVSIAPPPFGGTPVVGTPQHMPDVGIPPIPEPSMYLLFAAGAVAIALRHRLTKKR